MNSPSSFGLSEQALVKITSLLKVTHGVERALIFDSRALKTYRDGSDIDIAVNAPSMDFDRYLRLCSTLDDLELPFKIDLVLMHQVDSQSLLEHIERVGVDIL